MTLVSCRKEENKDEEISDDLFELLLDTFVMSKIQSLTLDGYDLTSSDSQGKGPSRKMIALRQKLYELKIKYDNPLKLKLKNCKIGGKVDFLKFHKDHEKLNIKELELRDVPMKDNCLNDLGDSLVALGKLQMVKISNIKVSTQAMMDLIDNEEKFSENLRINLNPNKVENKENYNHETVVKYYEDKRIESGKDSRISIL